MSNDIKVTDGTILEALNGKVDLDGGNFKGSGLEAIVKKNGGGGGLEIGDIGIAPLGIDETKGKRRYLNGQLIIQEQYVQFTNKVKSAVALYPSLACTEAEWQTTATMTVGGQVGKFVVDDEAGTIRLPKIIMPIQGLTDLSKLAEIVEAGLPNITGELTPTGRNFPSNYVMTGAFYGTSIGGKQLQQTDGSYTGFNLIFDASRSNPIYGNSNTVQQEQIQYPYFIQVATGAETEDNIINEIELNNPFSLLDYKYSEYELNNLSWLRSNGQYNSKAVYPAVYDLLLKIYNGTETKAGVSVKLATEEYTDTDFVLNTADETFRLPVKVKLASGKAVVGNGYGIALTTSSSTDPTTTAGTHYIFESTNNESLTGTKDYATSSLIAGTSISSSGYGGFSNNCVLGLSPNPELSGIETSDSDLYLYFYVGETVQNANLINAGRIEEIKANKTDVDGQWVYKAITLSTTTAVGTYTIDLSDYLPNDGYFYEVLFYGKVTNASTTVPTVFFGTDLVSPFYVSQVKSDASGTFADCWNAILPVGLSRSAIINITTIAPKECEVKAKLYRRIGTNA